MSSDHDIISATAEECRRVPKSKMKGGPKMSLLNAIQSGEGKNVEFKEELPVSQAIAKTVIAFSNTAGGKLIIGVNDQGNLSIQWIIDSTWEI
jgi:hypothetical protein